MYSYEWDPETGGLLLNTTPLKFSKEPRPVYYKELDLLGFNQYWDYDKDDSSPFMWAEANNYWYRGKLVAKTVGGALYTKPEIKIIDDPEENGGALRHVDIDEMVKRNSVIMESLTQATIKNVFNVFKDYEGIVDVFHVSYSGGKDSEVTLDIVKRAIPHNSFIVIFGDTGMEFDDTYKSISHQQEMCNDDGISFYIASSHLDPKNSWDLFGPPSSTNRWCCSVHKTAPQLLLIRNLLGRSDFKELAFVGVRADESIRRSSYDYVSLGTKHKGQYSCNPILHWNSAEVYLYIYSNHLMLNETYKKGNSRAGCLICPMASNRNDYMNYNSYRDSAEPLVSIIKDLNISERTEEGLQSYLENNGWKARKNGRDLSIGLKDYYEEKDQSGNTIIKCASRENAWQEWIKTIGSLETVNNEKYRLIVKEGVYELEVEKMEGDYIKVRLKAEDVKKHPSLFKNIKNVFKKSHCCIGCRVCEANCPYGNISFQRGIARIADTCIKCGMCHEIDNGCLRYDSLWLSRGDGRMKKSIDEYANHAPKMEWIKQFVTLGDDFNTSHTLGGNEFPAFKRFLRDSGIIDQNGNRTQLYNLLEKDEEDRLVWALMMVNLSYSSEIGWLVKRLDFDCGYPKTELSEMLANDGVSKSGQSSVPNAYRRISLLPLSSLGYGYVEEGNKKEGFVIVRERWNDPDPRVILYSLYKFAEACGGYYQFTLTRLLNHDVDSDGVSPTQIFGLGREAMERILNGLSVNYPDFIQASFTLDLDNITLRSDKKSDDVLELF